MPLAFIDHRRSTPISQFKFFGCASGKRGKQQKGCYTPVNGNSYSSHADPYTPARKMFFEFPKKSFYGDMSLEEPVVAAYSDTASSHACGTRSEPAGNSEPNWMIGRSRFVSLKRLSVPNYAVFETITYINKRSQSLDNLVDEGRRPVRPRLKYLRHSKRAHIQKPPRSASALALSDDDDGPSHFGPQNQTRPLFSITRVAGSPSRQQPLAEEASSAPQQAADGSERLKNAETNLKNVSGMCTDIYTPTLALFKASDQLRSESNTRDNADSDAEAFHRECSKIAIKDRDVGEDSAGFAEASAQAVSVSRVLTRKEDSLAADLDLRTSGCRQDRAAVAESSDTARFALFADDEISRTAARSSDKPTDQPGFIPWSKRTTRAQGDPFDLKQSKWFASLRLTRRRASIESDAGTSRASLAFSSLRSRKSVAENVCPASSDDSHLKLRRHKSDSDAISLRGLSSASTASVITSGSGLIGEYTNEPKTLLPPIRLKKNSLCFFTAFADKLRDNTFSLEFAASSVDDSKKHDDRTVEDVSEAFYDRLLDKTCKQLFYIRCRLSEHGRHREFCCDGIFGCDEHLEAIEATPAHWV